MRPPIENNLEHFRNQFKRDPGLEDHVFHTEPIKGYTVTPLYAKALWYRIRNVAKLAGETASLPASSSSHRIL